MGGSMYDRMLRIDCSNQTAAEWEIPESVREYVGGIGYGTKILIDEIDPKVDPLSPGNLLVMTVGPLTGTSAPMHPQTCIVTKSPLSGAILNSYAGGFLGAEIKFAGIDGLILEGSAPEWSLLHIDNGRVSFHSAQAVLGKGTWETERYLKERFGEDVRTLSIGMAGENGVAMASVFSETRTFGRGGAGAVLGSKRIKGIAIRGTGALQVSNLEEFQKLVLKDMAALRKACAEEYNLLSMFSRAGTGAGMGLVNARGALATHNHTYGSFKGASAIDGFAYDNRCYTRPVACYCCPVHCGMLRKFKRQDGSETWLRGPEYETMFSLGSNLDNGDPVLLAEANQLCNDYGMDSITAGVTVAWALEASERGILSEPGLPLKFGDRDTILELLHRTGRREGLGDLLAKGPKAAAEALGPEGLGFAMQIKNFGFPAWMPRRMKGTGLALVTANRGACHKRAPIGVEITGQIDMDSTESKAPLVKEIQDKLNALFTLISCRFHEFASNPEIYPQYVAAATGRELSYSEFLGIGERIWNLEKLFNLRAGFSRTDDCLPDRCFEPIKGEASEGAVLQHQQFEAMLDEYYQVRGWDKEGVPTQKKLVELDLEEYGRLI